MHSTSVSDLLGLRYQIAAIPGKSHQQCPQCGQHEFWIAPDNSFGKCFRANACGFTINTKEKNKLSGFWNTVLSRIYSESRKAFLKQLSELPALERNLFSRNPDAIVQSVKAARYLIHSRECDRRVVSVMPIGVVPNDLGALFADLTQEFEHFKQAATDPELPSQKRKQYQEQIQIIDENSSKLSAILRNCSGWIMFYYSDAENHLTGIKFRNPEQKDFRVFFPEYQDGSKIYSRGVFGLYETLTGPKHNACPIGNVSARAAIFEGEINVIRFQTMEVQGNPDAHMDGVTAEHLGFAFSCGASEGADGDLVAKLMEDPIVFYDNDDAGRKMAQYLREYRRLCATTTPIDPDDPKANDLDAYIKTFASMSDARAAVIRLGDDAPYLPRDPESIRTTIADSINKTRITSSVKLDVANLVMSDMKDRGQLFLDRISREVLYLRDGDLSVLTGKDFEEILFRYGLNPTEAVTRFVAKHIQLSATSATPVTIHDQSYWDRNTFRLYLFNGHDVYRIEPGRFEIVPNGTDGILFWNDPVYAPWELDQEYYDSLIPGTTPLLDTVTARQFTDGTLSRKDAQTLFRDLVPYIMFRSEDRPILLMTGDMDSGKTFALRCLGKVLLGPDFDVTQVNDLNTFRVICSNCTYAVIDNLDSAHSWLCDALCNAATSTNIIIRRLYTTNDAATFSLRAFVGITSITPKFTRSDVISRLLVLHLDPYRGTSDTSAQYIWLNDNRGRMLTELVHRFASEILPRLKQYGAEVLDLGDVQFRFRDFANYIYRIHDCDPQIHRIFASLSGAKTEFAINNDSFVDLLVKVLGHYVNQWVTFEDLRQTMIQFAETDKITFPDGMLTSRPSFNRRVSQIIRGDLAGQFRRIERPIGSNRKQYCFLKVVPEPEKTAPEQLAAILPISANKEQYDEAMS